LQLYVDSQLLIDLYLDFRGAAKKTFLVFSISVWKTAQTVRSRDNTHAAIIPVAIGKRDPG
jgi:hypothetical protein